MFTLITEPFVYVKSLIISLYSFISRLIYESLIASNQNPHDV